MRNEIAASRIIRNCFTSNSGHVACLLATLLKFRLSTATMKATKDGLEVLRLKTTSRRTVGEKIVTVWGVGYRFVV